MPNIPTLEELLKAGVHFGHQTSRWHPKMKRFIFGEKKGVHIIDIEKTQKELARVLEVVEETLARGGNIVFVGTKPQAQAVIEKYALDAGVPYVSNRWLGGTFTNFQEMQKRIKTFLDLQDKRDKGELKKYTKLEQLQFDRKIDELETKFGGLTTLTKLPDLVFIVDMKHDKTALTEARTRGINIIALCDSNTNPELVTYPIPANDDSVGSITLMIELVAEAAKIGRARAKSISNSQLPIFNI